MKINTIIDDLNSNKIQYYYQQGFEIGKEETLFYLVNKLSLSNISNEEISKIIDIPVDEVNALIS